VTSDRFRVSGLLEAESPVSYGSTWKSDHRVRVVTVPVGYGDGYFRSMSNRAQVILRGQRFSQVGAICMDQMMVNIESGTGYNGDEVVLIGEQQGERLTVEELAGWAGTIPYEILTAINERVPVSTSPEVVHGNPRSRPGVSLPSQRALAEDPDQGREAMPRRSFSRWPPRPAWCRRPAPPASIPWPSCAPTERSV